MVDKGTIYAVVRVTEGREWIDSGTLNLIPEESGKAADAVDKQIPQWAQSNPRVRIGTFTLTEIRPVGRPSPR